MSTDTEERVVVDVDLDAVLPCNVRRQGCHREAAWVFHCPQCGHPSQPCNICRALLDAWVWANLTPLTRLLCNHCEATTPAPIPWSPL